MTVDASRVTDALVADIKATYGGEKLVAMVLLLASANFQDRIILGLGLPPEDGGPIPPLEVKIRPRGRESGKCRSEQIRATGSARSNRQGRRSRNGRSSTSTPSRRVSRDQKANAGRIRVPTLEEVLGPAGPKGIRSPGTRSASGGRWSDGLPARVGRPHRAVRPGLPRGSAAGPRVRGKPLLDRHPHDQLFY